MIKSVTFILSLISLSCALVPILNEASPKKIAGSYILVFHQHASKEDRTNHLNDVLKEESYGNKVQHVYEIGNFRGYAATLNDTYFNLLRRHDNLFSYIEHDQAVRIADGSCKIQEDAVWGLNRISEREVNLNDKYIYGSNAGKGVTVYIIDTGILLNHVEFEGRATFGANFANDLVNDDCNGHGTHVAGTVGAKTYGVAKKTQLVAVKVLSCDGGGTNSGVIAGIEYVTSKSTKPAVANMSLGGGFSYTLNFAVAEAVKEGVTFVVAAGNENADACSTSPASEKSAITVGATTLIDESALQNDGRASFSNWGACVDILAPGELIKSAWIGSTSAVKTISGTSMASPHVAGVAALYLGENPNASPLEVRDVLIQSSSVNLIDLQCSTVKDAKCKATPNRLLYSPCN